MDELSCEFYFSQICDFTVFSWKFKALSPWNTPFAGPVLKSLQWPQYVIVILWQQRNFMFVGVLRFYMAVFNVVGMNGAEALKSRSGERDAGRATDVLHPFHLTDTFLEYTAEESQLTMFFSRKL